MHRFELVFDRFEFCHISHLFSKKNTKRFRRVTSVFKQNLGTTKGCYMECENSFSWLEYSVNYSRMNQDFNIFYANSAIRLTYFIRSDVFFDVFFLNCVNLNMQFWATLDKHQFTHLMGLLRRCCRKDFQHTHTLL